MPTLVAEAAGLHLRRTLDSGQAFRWRWSLAPDGGRVATGIVGSQVFCLTQDARGLWLLSPETPEGRRVLRRYLGMAARHRGGLARIEAALETDPVLARILPHTRGISLLAQDPWEVLISFIISQNNNIPKIAQSIERLARALGEPLAGPHGPGGDRFYTFPAPERLAAAHPHTLRACLLGYRAPYVRAAARMVAGGEIDLGAVRRLPADAARNALLRVPGVGEKVGDCILLFGLRRTSSFPVDVWVRRAVERLYFQRHPRRDKEIRAFAQERFGPLAGYAQQHLFTYARAFLRA
jgi:N-glycosylase/DNA lyase